jgi:DNA-binding response OmpR family regulator
MSGRGKTILILDDEPSSLELLDFLLKKEDFRTFLFSQGEDALKHAKKNPPDLVITDLLMPRMPGVDFCKALRADPFTHGIPILCLSAATGEKDIESGLRAGADAFIAKPFDPKKVIEKITELLFKPR